MLLLCPHKSALGASTHGLSSAFRVVQRKQLFLSQVSPSATGRQTRWLLPPPPLFSNNHPRFLQFLIINAAVFRPSPSSSPSLGHTLMCDVLKVCRMSEGGHQSSGQSRLGSTLVEVIIQQPTDFFSWLYLLEHFPKQCNEILSFLSNIYHFRGL